MSNMSGGNIASQSFGGGGLPTLNSGDIFVGNASNVATDVPLSGDATLSNTGALTIANNAITNAKAAQMAANTIKGNNTGSTANALDLTTSQVNTLLGTITSLTGDVTASGPGAAAATIANSAVTLAKMANLAANSIIGNNTGSPATPIALTVSQVNTLLGDVTTVAAIDTSAQANALFISGNNISTQSASVSNPGMVNTTTQSMAGNKTFTGTLVTSNSTASTSTTTGALRSSGGIGVAGSLSFGGAVYLNSSANVVSVNSNHTVQSTEYVILLDSSGGVFNLTLPNPNTVQMFIIKCSTGSCQTNPVTIVRNGSEQIDGTAASKVFSTNWGSWMFVSNGTNWFTVG